VRRGAQPHESGCTNIASRPPAVSGAAFELSRAFGAWRVVASEHAWHVDLVTLRDDGASERTRAPAVCSKQP
jgi:hypothetical protein